MQLVHPRKSIRLAWPVFLCIFLWVCNAWGQELPSSAAMVLKNFKPSGESCRRAEQADKPSNIVQREMFAPDLGCMISAQELLLWTKAGQSTVVDTRPQVDYAQFHMDGAINVPLHEVARKAYLRSHTITLVGTGKLERELYAACAQLKANGFKSVKVLQGGMLAWLAADHAVIGQAPAVDQLQRLESMELFAEGQFEANLLIVAKSESKMLNELNYAVIAPLDSAQGLKQVLEKHRRDPARRALSSVVWVAPAHTTAQELLQLRAVAAPLPLLVYLEGGAEYQRYLAEQKAVWLAQARGPKKANCSL